MIGFKWTFLLGLLSFYSANAADLDNPSFITQIESDHAYYKEKKLILSGDVAIEHELGKIQACEMELTPSKEETKQKFSFLTMGGNVHVSLKEGGYLQCHTAFLNYPALKGIFSSGPTQTKVVYVDTCRDREGHAFPLHVESKLMEVTITRYETPDSESAAKSELSQIFARGNVVVTYNTDFIASSERASYERLPRTSVFRTSQSALAGWLRLESDSPSKCLLINKNGDIVHSDEIDIDTVMRHFVLKNPQGTISLIPLSEDKNVSIRKPLEFSCEELIWEEDQEQLKLCRDVHLKHAEFGTLENEKEVIIYQQTLRRDVGKKGFLRMKVEELKIHS